MTRPRHIVGCMTGTSLDGLDVALIRVEGSGLSMRCRLCGHLSLPLDPGLRADLQALAAGQSAAPWTIMRCARALGELHAQAVQGLLTRHPVQADLVAIHGQTLWHAPLGGLGKPGDPGAPEESGKTSATGMSWQLIDPWPIVARCRVPVVYDLRQADLAAGGQGAPITPLADWILFRSDTVSRAIVNLGGICNITLLPRGGDSGQVTGEDVGPCNLLLDGLAQRLFGVPLDDQGKLAARGGASSLVHRLVLQSPFFSRPRPRSTGREDFSPGWIEALLRDTGLPGHDMLASAVEAVARLILEALETRADELVLAGGGAKNKTLVLRLRGLGTDRVKVRLLEELGVAAQAREACAFAVLGALAQDGVRLTLPQVTGVDPRKAPRFGAWISP